MSFSKISAGFLAAFVLAALPCATQAYFTTGQTAAPLTSNAALYTIEYAFGHEDYDIYMPVIAERGLLHDSDEEKVGYTLRENGDEVRTEGIAAGLVLSTTPIVDGMYKIAKGTAQKMTLLVLLVTDKDALETDYALQVEKLPYYVDRGGDEPDALELNTSELQYYVTKEVELNTGSFQ